MKTGLKDKNGKDILYGGQLLRIKNFMGDSKEFFTDSIYKTEDASYLGLRLSFVRLFNKEPDTIQNSFPIHSVLSFQYNSLDAKWINTQDIRLVLRDTFGENHLSKKRWAENHWSEDIEIIEKCDD